MKHKNSSVSRGIPFIRPRAAFSFSGGARYPRPYRHGRAFGKSVLVALLLLLGISFTSRSQIITTLAGSGQAGYSGDGGPATAADINTVFGIGVDASNNVYIADFAMEV